MKMKAIVATAYGSPEVFHLEEVEKPKPGPNELLIKVVASAATTADTMLRTGKPYFGRLIVGLLRPKHPIPGTGFAGVIEKLGENVKTFKVEDRVFGETTFGFSANAEYLVISEDGVVLPMPENLPFAEAASYCDGHLTSFNFLNEVEKVKPGQHVLIIGASGSLGTSAVQLAKNMGAHVTGVCSGRNAGLVKSLGADEVIDYQKEDFTRSQVKYDLIYDTVGKSSFSASKPVLKEAGVYLSPILKFRLLMEMLSSSLFGKKKAKFEATGIKSEDKLREMLSQLVKLFKAGKLKTVIDRQYPLEKLAEAHEYIDKGHKKGNVVIIVNPLS